MEVFFAAFFALLGLMLGSFLNVCIDRLPFDKSIISPPSKCDSCGRRLLPQDLIPLVSYLMLGGRCRYCGARIPKRVFAVELITGFILAFLYQYFGLSAEFGVTAFWAIFFILVFFIDLEQGLILNKIVYPSAAVALLLAAFAEPSWLEGWRLIPVVSAAVGGAVGLVLFWVIALISGGGMGWGDPIDRDPELAVKDVESGDLTPDVVESIYGIVLDKVDGRLKVNREATERARAHIKERRKKEAVPFKEWWRSEREKVLNKDFGPQEEVEDMYRDGLRWAETREEFTRFWQVGKDYSI